jgi:hypothetical protein
MQKSEMGIATSHVGALPRPATLPGRGAKEYSVDADAGGRIADGYKSYFNVDLISRTCYYSSSLLMRGVF